MTTALDARVALTRAEERKDVRPDFPGLTPFAQAVAEYMSLSGPWNEEDGEYAGESGYRMTMS